MGGVGSLSWGPGGLGRFGRPLGGPEGVRRPFQRAREGWEGWERSGGPPGGPGEVERPSRKGREELGGPLREPGGVGRPCSKGSGRVGRLSLRVGKGRRPNKREGEIGRPSRRAGRVGRPSRWVGRDQESPQVCWEGLGVTLEGWEGWGGPPGGLGSVGRSSLRVVRGREAHPDGCGVWKPSQKGREDLGVPHRG